MARQGFGQIQVMRSGRFQARHLHPTAKTRADGRPNIITAPVTFRTKTEAQTWLAKQQADIARDTWQAPEDKARERAAKAAAAKRDALTFGEYAEALLRARKYRPTTRANYRSYLTNHVLPTWEDVPLKEITADGLEAWLTEVAPGSPEARKGAWKVVSLVLRAAFNKGVIPSNPCRAVEFSRLEAAPASETTRANATHGGRALTPDELTKLAAEVPEYMALPVLLAGTVGLRLGEVRALTGSALQVDADGKAWVNITQAVSGEGKLETIGEPKTAKSTRSVPVPSSLLEELEALADQRGFKGLLFPSTRDPQRPIPKSTFLNNLKRAGVRAGLGHVTLHDLRRTAVTGLLAQGHSPTAIRDLVGHETTRMTDRYAKTHSAEIAAMVDALDRERTNPTPNNVVPMRKRKAA